MLRTERSQPGTQPWPAHSCPTRAGSHWLFRGMCAYGLLIAFKFSVITEIQAASMQILLIAEKSIMEKWITLTKERNAQRTLPTRLPQHLKAKVRLRLQVPDARLTTPTHPSWVAAHQRAATALYPYQTAGTDSGLHIRSERRAPTANSHPSLSPAPGAAAHPQHRRGTALSEPSRCFCGDGARKHRNAERGDREAAARSLQPRDPTLPAPRQPSPRAPGDAEPVPRRAPRVSGQGRRRAPERAPAPYLPVALAAPGARPSWVGRAALRGCAELPLPYAPRARSHGAPEPPAQPAPPPAVPCSPPPGRPRRLAAPRPASRVAAPRPGVRHLEVPCSQNRERDGRFADLGLTERSRITRRDLPRICTWEWHRGTRGKPFKSVQQGKDSPCLWHRKEALLSLVS